MDFSKFNEIQKPEEFLQEEPPEVSINIRPVERLVSSAGAVRKAVPPLQAQVIDLLVGDALDITKKHNLENIPVGIIVIKKSGFTDVFFDFDTVADGDRIRDVRLHRSVDKAVTLLIF